MPAELNWVVICAKCGDHHIKGTGNWYGPWFHRAKKDFVKQLEDFLVNDLGWVIVVCQDKQRVILCKACGKEVIEIAKRDCAREAEGTT